MDWLSLQAFMNASMCMHILVVYSFCALKDSFDWFVMCSAFKLRGSSCAGRGEMGVVMVEVSCCPCFYYLNDARGDVFCLLLAGIILLQYFFP